MPMPTGIPTGLDNQTVALSPNVNGAVPTAASIGSNDWVCTGASSMTAVGRGMNNVNLGSLRARYLLAECR